MWLKMMKLIMMLSIFNLLLVLGVAGFKVSAEVSDQAQDSELNSKNIDPSLINYVLWTRSHDQNMEFSLVQSGNLTSLEVSTFDGSHQTYFLIHGYTDNAFKKWILDTKDALLSMEDCNVFSVEYKDFVLAPNYIKAVSNMYEVAAATASYIDWLVEGFGLSTGRVHLIGHSLGAHAAGMTASYVTSGQIDRVTGLDPAGPLFYSKGSDERLDKSQASFVDVIHSNGCSLLGGCQGIAKPIGHVDFYPNGGENQNGCSTSADLADGCSHQVVTSFWTEGVTAGTNQTSTFVSWPCQDWDTYMNGGCQDCGQGCLDMGLHVQRDLEGSYYLSTSDSSPYALGNVQQPSRYIE